MVIRRYSSLRLAGENERSSARHAVNKTPMQVQLFCQLFWSSGYNIWIFPVFPQRDCSFSTPEFVLPEPSERHATETQAHKCHEGPGPVRGGGTSVNTWFSKGFGIFKLLLPEKSGIKVHGSSKIHPREMAVTRTNSEKTRCEASAF